MPRRGLLEQVGGLSADLERILFVEQFQIEQLVRHTPIVIQTDTDAQLFRTLPGLSRS